VHEYTFFGLVKAESGKLMAAHVHVENTVECFDLGRVASGRLAVQSSPLPDVVDGRLYASLGAMQLSPRTRAFVLAPEYALYDMVNAFPCLLRAEFKRKGIQCEALDLYCDNREAIIARIVHALWRPGKVRAL